MPLGAELNLPEDLYSHRVRRKVADYASRTLFEDVGATLPKETGALVPKRQLKELCQDVAEDFEVFYAERAAEAAPEEASVLCSGFDASGVHMRPEGLREATRKEREADEEPPRWLRPASTKAERRYSAPSPAPDFNDHVGYPPAATDIRPRLGTNRRVSAFL